MISGIILAGGRGTRMKEIVPKVLITVENKTIIENTVDVLKKVVKDVIVVVGDNYNKVFEKLNNEVLYAHQDIPLGTLDAVKKTIPYLNTEDISLIVPADIPYLDEKILADVIRHYPKDSDKVIVVGMKIDNPSGYGRLKMNDNHLVKIIEEKDANGFEKELKSVNTGIYLIPNKIIIKYINMVAPNKITNEYYLTDLINYIIDFEQVEVIIYPENIYLQGANDVQTLNRLRKIHQKS